MKEITLHDLPVKFAVASEPLQRENMVQTIREGATVRDPVTGKLAEVVRYFSVPDANAWYARLWLWEDETRAHRGEVVTREVQYVTQPRGFRLEL